MSNFLLFLWVFSLGLGQFGKIASGEFGGVYYSDILAFSFVLYSLFLFLLKRDLRFFIPRAYFWFFGFCLWNVISLIYNTQSFLVEETLYGIFYFTRIILYVIGGLCLYNLKKFQLIQGLSLNLVIFYALFLSFSGFVQLVIFPNFSQLDPSLGWDPHINRLLGTLFDPNFMGATLVLCFNIILSHYNKSLNKRAVIILFTILLAILLTFSRSAWLMLSISIFIWGILKYPRLLFISFFIAFLAYFAVPRVQTRLASITDPADSAHFRLISWKNTIKIAQDNLLFGTGYNTFRFAQKEYGFFGVDFGGRSGGGADSSLLLILATTGIPGLIFFSAFLLHPFISHPFLKAQKRNYAFSASIPALLIGSFFINSLFYPQILFLWNLILAESLESLVEPTSSYTKS